MKIFFEEGKLYLCNEIDSELEAMKENTDVRLINEPSKEEIESILRELKSLAIHTGILLSSDIDELKKLFFGQFEFIEAAGGVVENTENELLFIFRRGKWDLPKGKLEANETIAECAEREIAEETGINNLILQQHLINTYHVYESFGKKILKKSYWYYFKTNNTLQPIAQIEEDITEAKWTKPAEVQMLLSNSYETIKEVIQTYLEIQL